MSIPNYAKLRAITRSDMGHRIIFPGIEVRCPINHHPHLKVASKRENSKENTKPSFRVELPVSFMGSFAMVSPVGDGYHDKALRSYQSAIIVLNG